MSTVVFYDTQNVAINGEVLDQILTRIGQSPIADRIVDQWAYIVDDGIKRAENSVRQAAEARGIHVVELKAVVHNGKTKPNQVDLKMYADILSVTLKKPSVTTVAVVTGDGDFRYLFEVLHSHKKKALLVSNSSASSSLLCACNDWINLRNEMPPSKALLQIWRERVAYFFGKERYAGMDFLRAIALFMGDCASDTLISRVFDEGAVDLELFRNAMAVFIKVPNYHVFGYKTWSLFIADCIAGTGFALSANGLRIVREAALQKATQQSTQTEAQSAAQGATQETAQGDAQITTQPFTQPATQPTAQGAVVYDPLRVYKHFLRMDERYRPARMEQWLKNFARYSPRQLGELFFYADFLIQNGLVDHDAEGAARVPDVKGYRTRMTKKLRRSFESAGLKPDKETLEALRELF
ncbi:MAG: NYN domain-containing protein [Clostridiales bacterium]|jgi:uncharacterized LabA/DUF88 family protein|nr:NYN domain-containing protein [Clostridiales bacterium]